MKLFRALSLRNDSGIFREIPMKSPGKLFTSPMPTGAYDKRNRLFKIYKLHKIDHVFSLVTDRELEKKARKPLLQEYEKRGITYSRYIIEDFQAPSGDVIQHLVEEALDRLEKKQNLLVHCHAGVGRTSLAVSCIYMTLTGCSPEEAISHVKNNMLVNITSEQTRFIKQFKLEKEKS